MEMHYDVIVVGGGASGMQAAVVAAERGLSVLLVEKNATLGKKLAITGGGRCNILNAEPDVRKLLSQYGDAMPYLFSAFSQYGMSDTWEWFVAQGLPLTIEANQRAFPASERAHDVVALFVRLLARYNVVIKTNTPVTEIRSQENSIVGVVTGEGTYTAQSYIIATGGLSHPETGSTGDGHDWLRQLGIPVQEPNPSLVPLMTSDQWMHDLSGVSLADAGLTFTSTVSKRPPVTVRGKMLFTHFGISGPAVLNAAGTVRDMLGVGPVSVTINLLPELSIDVVHERVQEAFSHHKNTLLRNLLRHISPPGMASAVAKQLPSMLAETPVHSVSRADRIAVGKLLQKMPGTVVGVKGNDAAIVSDGGVVLDDVDTRTMRVRKYKNLYVTGDVLHISRPSGGYSLQLCWTTGTIAGRSVT
jgi:hypothetical protein